MVPMIPDPITIDLGSQGLSFGWSMDGSVLLVLAVLIVPWILLGLAVVAELLDSLMHPAETPLPTAVPLREAA